MPTRRPGDHLTGLSRASGGIRHDIFSDSAHRSVAGGMTAWPLRRARMRSTIDDDDAAGRQGDGQPDEDGDDVDVGKEGGGHEGAREDQQHADDARRPRTLSHLGLTHGPSTSRSLHSSSRKTLADGSRRPARAWTLVVIRPSGASGDQHDAGGSDDHGGVAQVELLGFLEATVQGVADAEDVAEGVAGREGDRGGADDAGVEEEDGEQGAQDLAAVGQEVGDADGVGEVPERGGARWPRSWQSTMMQRRPDHHDEGAR